MVHCLKDNTEYAEEKYGLHSKEHLDSYDEESAACMLPDGHEGDCELVPTDQIIIRIK